MKKWVVFLTVLLLISFSVPQVFAQEGTKLQWLTPEVKADRIQYVPFFSNTVQTKVSYHVYIPEAYDTAKHQRFPVLYWLHGTGGGLKAIPHLAKFFGSPMSGGKIPPMIVVFPNGFVSSMWMDSKDKSLPMETVLIKELVPHVDKTFRTMASREGRIIEGFSMGGYGAARLGFKYHDLFIAASLLAGGPLQPELIHTPLASAEERDNLMKTVYGNDHNFFKTVSPWVLAKQNAAALKTSRLRMVVGDRDEVLENNRIFHEHLLKLNIAHAYKELPGVGHNPLQFLTILFRTTFSKYNWEFYRSVLGF